jgi:hypothetical protein
VKANVTIPDFAWYSAIGSRQGLSPRCPFASVERCPRYYQSLSLLGDAGFTKIEAAEEERLLSKWKSSEFWPRTGEQTTSVHSSGKDDVLKPFLFSNYCPEVSYEGFGLFASSMARYADELDLDFSHRRLGEIGAPREDWRWTWAHVHPMHYTECALYSPLKEQGHATKMPMTDSLRTYLNNKLGSIAAQAIEDSLKAVSIAQGKATLADALGGPQAYLSYNEAVAEVMKTALPRMARLAFHASGCHTDEVASLLDAVATKMVAGITEALNKKFSQAARAFGERPLVGQLTEELTRMKGQLVDDFRHGLDGDAPLATQKPGNTYNVTQANSPGAQLAVGDHNQQNMQVQSTALVSALDELMTSALERLNSSNADEVRRLADLVRVELQKPVADVSSVKSWTDRIGEIIAGAGLVVEAGKLARALAEWWSSCGGYDARRSLPLRWTARKSGGKLVARGRVGLAADEAGSRRAVSWMDEQSRDVDCCVRAVWHPPNIQARGADKKVREGLLPLKPQLRRRALS